MYLQTQWNPIKTVTNGPKKFGCINGVAILKRVFFTRKCIVVVSRCPKQVAISGGFMVGIHDPKRRGLYPL